MHLGGTSMCNIWELVLASKGLKLVQNFQNKPFSHCRIAFDQAFTHSEVNQEYPRNTKLFEFYVFIYKVTKNRIYNTI